MKNINKFLIVCIVLFMALFLTGCGKGNIESLSDNIKKIELTGNLVTYKVYYHNVMEYDKKASEGFTHIFEKNRKLFCEYTGTIKLGINLSDVKVNVNGTDINVFIPKAFVIGEPNIDKDNFTKNSFIESKDGINKNEITADDITLAFDEAQKNLKDEASNDRELLSLAQKRAKVVIEENINKFSSLNENQYTINWEYGQ